MTQEKHKIPLSLTLVRPGGHNTRPIFAITLGDMPREAFALTPFVARFTGGVGTHEQDLDAVLECLSSDAWLGSMDYDDALEDLGDISFDDWRECCRIYRAFKSILSPQALQDLMESQGDEDLMAEKFEIRPPKSI